MPNAADLDKVFQDVDDDLDFGEGDLDTEAPPKFDKRGPGRPRKYDKAPRGTKKTRTRVLLQEEVDDEEIEAPPLQDDGGNTLPLFPSIGRNVVKHIRVIRVEPNEGTLGRVSDPMLNEEKIKALWGGGTFRLQALGADGQIRKVNTVEIAGDPVFQSLAAQRAWEKRNGLPLSPAPNTNANQQGGLDIKEILAIIQEKEGMRSSSELQMQERMRQMQIEADERRRRDEDERERRRRIDEEDRERRQAAQRREDEQRAQQNLQQMLALMNASHAQTMQVMQAQVEAAKAQASAAPKDGNSSLVEAIKTIAIIKETFGGGENASSDQEENLMNMLVKHGPEWLNAAGNAIGSAVREVKGTPAAAPAFQPPRQQNVLAALPPNLSRKAETFVAKLVAKGRDPEKELDTVLDGLNRAVDAMPDANGNAPPAREVSPTPTKPVPDLNQNPPTKPLIMRRNTVEASDKVDGVVSLTLSPRAK